MMMRLGDILGRIFFILSQKSIIGIYPRSTRRTRIFGKMFWSSEDRVRARFHYAESRQNKP